MLTIDQIDTYFECMEKAFRQETHELVEMINDRLAMLRTEEALIHTYSEDKQQKIWNEIRFMNLLIRQFEVFEKVFKDQARMVTKELKYYKVSIETKNLVKDRNFWKAAYFNALNENLELLDLKRKERAQ